VLHLVLAQLRVCGVHVADDDRDVLEPLVVAPAVHRHRPPFRREVVDQLDFLAAQAQAHDARTHAEHAEQVLVGIALDFDLKHHLERQDAGVESERAVHVADRDADRIDPADRCRAGALERAQSEQEQGQQQPHGRADAWQRSHYSHPSWAAR
jgi:hypothetical protein